jgi:chemotaxis signal transduction protein
MNNTTSKVQALRRALLDPAEVESAMGVVALTPDLTPETLVQLTQEYRERCERICVAMEDLTFEGDESEAEKHIPLTWLAMRYEWSRCNDQMQYQTILRGQADPLTMAHGSMLSKIAEKLEALQTRQELFWTLKLAADPFGTVNRIPLMTKRLMGITASAGRGISQVLQEFYTIREVLAGHLVDRELLDKLDKAISRSIEFVDHSVGIELYDLHAALEAELVERLATSGVTALIKMENKEGAELIPPEVSDLFFEVSRAWLVRLFEDSVEKSPAEREANGKSTHLTLTWRMERNDRKLIFILRDDGPGINHFETWKEDLPPGLQVRHSHEPGVGSELVIESNFMLNGNAEYLSFSVFNGKDSSTLAIPAQYVSSISLVDQARLESAAEALFMPNGDFFSVLDTAKTVFGAQANYSQNLVVFADLGETSKLALKVNEIKGICRGRVKPLPFGAGGNSIAGVLNNDGELVMVLNLEAMLSS